MKIFGEAKTNVRIGYVTHNGAERVVAYAQTRDLARAACAFANRLGGTAKERAKRAVEFLKIGRV